jgi:hypothetical protein
MALLRVTLRDLFWLTLVAALTLGWWLDHRSASRRHAREKDALLQEMADMLHEGTNEF